MRERVYRTLGVSVLFGGFLFMSSTVLGGLLTSSYPTGLPGGLSASPSLVALPPGTIAVDYVNIGDVESEVGHTMSGWGPVEPATSGGIWGYESNTRVIWEKGTDDSYRSASIDVDFGSTPGTKYLAMRWLDGISYADSFGFTISSAALGVVFAGSVTDGTSGHPETWYDLGAWNVGPINGVFTVTLTATDAAWSGFNTWGQGGFSEMATFVANCYPEAPEDIVADPVLVAEPSGAVLVDFVDIGKPASEAGHPMSSWGPVEPLTTGGNWGGEDDCRVIWDTATDSPGATIDMDFGEAPGHKYVVLRWLDGMANMGVPNVNDSFAMNVQGVGTTFNLTNGTAGHPEMWYFLCAWDVGDVRGIRTITLTATGSKWTMWNTYGQVAFSQIATLSDACEGCGAVPTAIGITPGLTSLPNNAVQVDFVDIGANDASELAHNLVSWGPAVGQDYPGSGNWGGEDDCRVIWDTATDSPTATIDMDFGTGTGNKYLAMRWLDGIATGNDSFTFSVGGGPVFTVTDAAAANPETWYDLCVWNVGAITGVQTITLTATGAKWAMWGTYGQVGFSTMAAYEEFCEADPPSGVDAVPDLVALPDEAAMIDYVDIGNAASELGHNLQGWGPEEPATHGGGWGGEDDCKVIWQNGSPGTIDLAGKCAAIDLDFGAAAGAKFLAMRWLDGLANDGTTMGAHDSFRFMISGSDKVYTVHDLTVAQGENWYDLCVWYVGEIKDVHTVSLCATGSQWSGFNTFGQVAFSEMATYVSCGWAGCDPEAIPDDIGISDPGLEFLPEDAVEIDYVDIGGADSGYNLQSWGPVEPLTTGGNWGGEDDCRVIWQAGGSTSATIDMDFGNGTGDKFLALRWLDGMANTGGDANDSFDVTVGGTTFSVTNGTSNHAETWYDVCAFNVGPVTDIQTVTLNATGGAWSGQGTYGQVAFSEMITYAEWGGGGAPPLYAVNVTVRLLGVEGPANRCIEFTPADDLGFGAPINVDVLLTGNPATGMATFEVGEEYWTTLFAKDEQHALSASVDLTLTDSTYHAEVALDCLSGDTDNNDLVDIDDVTWLIATYGGAANGGTHPWNGTRDADFNLNGAVGTEDFTYLSMNWLKTGQLAVALNGAMGRSSTDGLSRVTVADVKTSIRTRELPSWVVDRTDLNRDGVVDVLDVRRFETIHRLGNELSTKIEKASSLKRVTATRDRD